MSAKSIPDQGVFGLWEFDLSIQTKLRNAESGPCWISSKSKKLLIRLATLA